MYLIEVLRSILAPFLRILQFQHARYFLPGIRSVVEDKVRVIKRMGMVVDPRLLENTILIKLELNMS